MLRNYRANPGNQLNDLHRILNYIENHETSNVLKEHLAWGCIGGICGAFLGGKSGATLGMMLGAAIGHNAVPDYTAICNAVKKLRNDSKHLLWNDMLRLIGTADFEEFQKWWENSSNQEKLMTLLINAINAYSYF
ncbi:hypothetical protein CAEBREN_18133 [Caenorhabditis brenneri]|uniref:Uncharacterized protein n=1 Tax=Caenorhabditis brenneri TaxID=135651 RepID=G0N5A4_CAEBE|nr:hypothetical protein CAEBREN_18133 [Caenorhabditis brenneri]